MGLSSSVRREDVDISTARLIVLRRFLVAARTSDVTEEGLLDAYPGRVSELVSTLYMAGLLERVQGSGRGLVYITSATGRQLVAELPRDS
jgi:hypothetical protein